MQCLKYTDLDRSRAINIINIFLPLCRTNQKYIKKTISKPATLYKIICILLPSRPTAIANDAFEKTTFSRYFTTFCLSLFIYINLLRLWMPRACHRIVQHNLHNLVATLLCLQEKHRVHTIGIFISGQCPFWHVPKWESEPLLHS